MAAPVVVPALTTAFAATSISAAAATVATTAIIGAGISGTTSVVNQLIDNGRVNVKQAALDTLSGGLKGAAAGLIAISGVGAVGAFACKIASNAVVDTASDYVKARFIDGTNYGKGDAVKSVATSIFSTTVGHIIGKGASKLPIYRAITNNTNINLDNGTAKAIYTGYSAMASARTVRGVYPISVDIAGIDIYEAIVGYVTSNFLNYDRGLIQKQIQKEFGLGYSDIVNKVYDQLYDQYMSNQVIDAGSCGN